MMVVDTRLEVVVVTRSQKLVEVVTGEEDEMVDLTEVVKMENREMKAMVEQGKRNKLMKIKTNKNNTK